MLRPGNYNLRSRSGEPAQALSLSQPLSLSNTSGILAWANSEYKCSITKEDYSEFSNLIAHDILISHVYHIARLKTIWILNGIVSHLNLCEHGKDGGSVSV